MPRLLLSLGACRYLKHVLLFFFCFCYPFYFGLCDDEVDWSLIKEQLVEVKARGNEKRLVLCNFWVPGFLMKYNCLGSCCVSFIGK